MEDIWSKEHRAKHNPQPCSAANAISYKTFCQLGALLNPRLAKKAHQFGKEVYFTYHLT